jgi:hypothetical protein
MKLILKIIALLSVLLILAGSFFSCIDQETNPLEGVYYVVGYDGYYVEDVKEGTAKSGGYLLVSENLKDSLVVYNLRRIDDHVVIDDLFDGVFDFPREIMQGAGGCPWWYLFPEEYRFTFKMQITHRPITEQEFEKINHPKLIICAGPHYCLVRALFKKNIIITSISKNQ